MLIKEKKRKSIFVIIMAMILGILMSGLLETNHKVYAATPLVWPVPGHKTLSQGFHDGNAIDISDGSIAGADVVAAIGGTVTHIYLCGQQHYGSAGDCNGFGTGLVIQGTDGRIYQYAHMQANSIPENVRWGSTVSAGQKIGAVGTTGNSSGNHLHFAISLGNYWNQSGINPQNETYVDSASPGNVISWSDCTVSYCDHHNATINGRANASYRGTFTEAGGSVWDSNGNLVAQKTESILTPGSYLNVWYDIMGEMGTTLLDGANYQYQMYVVFDGQRYESPKVSFSTVKLSAHNAIDAPANGVIISNDILNVQGWAIYGRGVNRITYRINNGTESTLEKYYRSDIQSMYTDYPRGNDGFRGSIDVSGFPEGTNTIDFYAYYGDGTHEKIGSRSFVISSRFKVKNFTVTPTGSAESGKKVTLKVTVSGGSSPYQYRYTVSNNKGDVYEIQKYSSKSNAIWYTSTPGSKTLTVEVKDQTGKVVKKSISYTVKEKALSITGKVNLTTVNKGQKVTITSKADGGTGNYTYSFLIYNKLTGQWSRLTDFGKNEQYIWTAISAGDRQFYIEVKDSSGKIVRSNPIEVQVKDPLNVTLKTNITSIKKGGQIILTANASGGSGGYTYSFLVHNKDTGEWSRLNNFDSNSKRNWTAPSIGKRAFYVEVKDSKGTVVRSSAVEVQVSNPLSVSLKSSAGSVNKGSQITLTANASGGSGGYTYSFLVNNKDTGEWSRLNSFESSSKKSWTAPSTGKRVFYVEVKDSKGTVVRSSSVEVQVSNPLSVSLKSSVGSVKKGGQITLTANASGGSGGYTYSFLVNNKDTGEWSRLNGFTNSRTNTWTAPSGGRRAFYVEVKDSKGTVVRSSAVEVQVISPLSVSLKSSAGSVKKGGQITLTVNAAGGSGSYTYSFLVNNKDTGEWCRLNGFTSSRTNTWTAPSGGRRVFYVEVKDNSGTIVRSSALEINVIN